MVQQTCHCFHYDADQPYYVAPNYDGALAHNVRNDAISIVQLGSTLGPCDINQIWPFSLENAQHGPVSTHA